MTYLTGISARVGLLYTLNLEIVSLDELKAWTGGQIQSNAIFQPLVAVFLGCQEVSGRMSEREVIRCKAFENGFVAFLHRLVLGPQVEGGRGERGRGLSHSGGHDGSCSGQFVDDLYKGLAGLEEKVPVLDQTLVDACVGLSCLGDFQSTISVQNLNANQIYQSISVILTTQHQNKHSQSENSAAEVCCS